MPNSIYSQLSRSLIQVVNAGGRSIFYRGKVIPCVVQNGYATTKLSVGGIDYEQSIGVKVQKELVPIGNDGDPHTNESVNFPAYDSPTNPSRGFMIMEVLSDEYSYTFKLVDPDR